jgi:hypothetical protein
MTCFSIVVLAKQYESELNQVEPWYGTKYKVAKLPEEVLEVNKVCRRVFECYLVLCLEMEKRRIVRRSQNARKERVHTDRFPVVPHRQRCKITSAPSDFLLHSFQDYRASVNHTRYGADASLV